MRRSILVLAALLLAVTASLAAAASSPAPDRAVAMLNGWRASVGLAPVAHDPARSEGCRLHAEYYRVNHVMGHSEDPARPGYTAAGDEAASSSVLSFGIAGETVGPYGWEDGPYHRVALLDPALATTGFWAEHGLGCMGVDTGRPEQRRAASTPALVAYPYPSRDQQGVPTGFGCNEMPNPCELIPGSPTSTGFILSVAFTGPWSSQETPAVASASLVPDGGAPLAVSTEGRGSPNAPFLRGTLLVVPHQPLAAATWYTARVTGSVAYRGQAGSATAPFDVTWRFRTAQEPELSMWVEDGVAHIRSQSPEPVTVTGWFADAVRHLATVPVTAGDGGYVATYPLPLTGGPWNVCAEQAGRGDVWGDGRSCGRESFPGDPPAPLGPSQPYSLPTSPDAAAPRAPAPFKADEADAAAPRVPARPARGVLRMGSDRADRLRGTRRADRLAGRAGADPLTGLAGDDVLDGGAGPDRIAAGAGRDRVTAGAGDDVVDVRDRARDTVRCGAGRDRVTADRVDVLLGCEDLRRR